MLWEKSFAIPIYLFEDTNVQDLFNRAKTYLGESFIDFIKYFSEVLRLTITIISLIAFMGFINLKLIIYLLFITLISIVLKTVIEVKVKNFDKGNTIYGRKSYYLSNILTESTFLKEGKIFNYKDYISEKWIYNSKKYLENRGSIRRKEIFIGLLIGLLNIFLIFTTINTIIYEGKKENIIPDITVALWVLILLQNYTYSIVVNMQVLISSSLNLNDIIDVLRLEEETERQYSLKDIKSIELKNVFFKYPNTNEYVLKNINLSLKTTDKLVIVGQNGSGKSTLLKIILGFYDDYEGEIFINGTPLSKISKKSIYDNSSVVLQNITKFPIDIKEYIHLGTKKLFSSIDIENYFIDTNIDNFIKKLDSKHNTFLGNFQNNNSNISGGQWNQLVFMREILKRKDFLILDEVTSNLDPLTEKNI
ncbi:ATP-binding cassette domain-containing protein [Mammaliicoccus sciuri]|uniref:ATP-binding cassette domain-containing protein n=1 Tax=Mammaliicoccus sciuri TaxID=1296 RepID=UPI0034DD2579